MSPDWTALEPHRPLGPDAAAYVPVPSRGGEAIAARVLAGQPTVLVGGPAGVGKSTELAHAAALLHSKRVTCLLPLDRWENMRRLTVDGLFTRIASRVVQVATEVLHLPVSDALRAAATHAQPLRVSTDGGPVFEAGPEVLAGMALAEVVRLSRQGGVTLLLDGFEKVPQGPGSLELFDALGRLARDVELVVVIPWHVAFGSDGAQVVRPGERLEMLRAPDVEGEGAPGRKFLREILARRLAVAVPAAVLPLVEQAIDLSGGLPRTFLQLLADAGTYARLRGDEGWPGEADFAEAVADQRDSFRRVLLPGDTAAIRAVAGTDGRELDLPRRVRLMAHGVLLERLQDRRPTLEIHPLVRAVVEEGSQSGESWSPGSPHA